MPTSLTAVKTASEFSETNKTTLCPNTPTFGNTPLGRSPRGNKNRNVSEAASSQILETPALQENPAKPWLVDKIPSLPTSGLLSPDRSPLPHL